MAAEYVLKEGNEHVMLCERGIRTFEPSYRFTLDLMAVPVLRELTHLPIVIDPSHAAGKRSLVEPLSLAAAAAGRRRHHRRGPPVPRGGGLRRPAGAATPTTSRTTCASSRRRRSWPASTFATRLMRIAVLGVGLIGGSIGLAAREHVEGAEVVGFGRDPSGSRRRVERGRDRPRGRVDRGRRRRRGALLRLRAGGRAARRWCGRRSTPRAGHARHRRRLDEAATS